MRRLLLTAPPLALALFLTACGGDAAEPEGEGGQAADAGAEEPGADGARSAAEDFAASLRDADGEAGCALLDEAARTLLTSDQGTDDCGTAYAAYAESLEGAAEVEVADVSMDTDLDGDTAIARVDLVLPDDAGTGALELRQDADGRWLATRLPGTTLGGA